MVKKEVQCFIDVRKSAQRKHHWKVRAMMKIREMVTDELCMVPHTVDIYSRKNMGFMVRKITTKIDRKICKKYGVKKLIKLF